MSPRHMETAQGHQNRNSVCCREVFNSWASLLLKKVMNIVHHIKKPRGNTINLTVKVLSIRCLNLTAGKPLGSIVCLKLEKLMFYG